VLIGINGVGKSSILECLAILLSQLIGNITLNKKESSYNNAVNIQGQRIEIQGSVYGDVHFYTGDKIPLQLSQNTNKIRHLNNSFRFDIPDFCPTLTKLLPSV
jgi:ABC-type cobalamin/Fe3+-siderophores transport system ATPase subunit